MNVTKLSDISQNTEIAAHFLVVTALTFLMIIESHHYTATRLPPLTFASAGDVMIGHKTIHTQIR